MKQNITINKEQGLYVIPCGGGYSCLGFDNVLNKVKALSKELSLPIKNFKRGSMSAYNNYLNLCEIAREKNIKSGWRSTSELYAPFIGNEGRRVEVEYTWGEKERFYIGKSTGFIPCHVMIKNLNSSGGGSVLNNSIKSFQFVGTK